MPKEKIKKILFQTLCYELHVILTTDVMESRRNRDYLFGSFDEDWSARAVHSQNGAGLSHIYLNNNADIGEVVHESFHCLWAIMSFIGAKFENEICAYTLTFIVRDICAFMNKCKQKKFFS